MTRSEVFERLGAIMRLASCRIFADSEVLKVFKICYHSADSLVAEISEKMAIFDGIKYEIREEVEND